MKNLERLRPLGILILTLALARFALIWPPSRCTTGPNEGPVMSRAAAVVIVAMHVTQALPMITLDNSLATAPQSDEGAPSVESGVLVAVGLPGLVAAVLWLPRELLSCVCATRAQATGDDPSWERS
eukprot:6129272-Pyramimonas_sp.AAC.1